MKLAPCLYGAMVTMGAWPAKLALACLRKELAGAAMLEVECYMRKNG